MDKLDYEKVFKILVRETTDYVTNNHLKCMVLGISGGIDSTVVAAICYEVSKQTGIPLIGRSLPIKNKDDEFDVSKLVGEAFCDDFRVCNLYSPYSEFINRMMIWEYFKGEEGHELDVITPVAGKVFGAEHFSIYSEHQTPIANGNIQARLRMIYLYNLASIHKGLVMSTDNQTEYQLGFWTIHGDVGDFNPLQDLWKTEVYGLAKWLCEYTKEEHDKLLERKYSSIPDIEFAMDRYHALKESIALTPTDGLGISNSDLEQIGARSYAEVDDILQSFLNATCVEKAKSVEYLLYTKYPTEVVSKVWNRHLASEFKREKSPMFICRSRYE